MDPNTIANNRVYSQHIAGDLFDTPYEVVKHFGAMQAQDYSSSLWAIGLRTKNATQTDIARAISNRKIIRTWPMRGTLHFVAAEDARWILTLLGDRILRKLTSRKRIVGLDDLAMHKAHKIVVSMLSGGHERTRLEIFAALDKAGLDSKNQRGYHILIELSLKQVICFGPHSGKQPTFVLLDEWIPINKSLSLSTADSLAQLATFFFRSHGPAFITDLSGWAGLTLTEARTAVKYANINMIMPELYGPEASPAKPSGTFLLPGFDEFIIGYKNRSHIMHPDHMAMIVPGNNGMFLPTIITDGVVTGTWKRTVTTKKATVQMHPFKVYNAQQKADIKNAIKRYEAFIGLQIAIV